MRVAASLTGDVTRCSSRRCRDRRYNEQPGKRDKIIAKANGGNAYDTDVLRTKRGRDICGSRWCRLENIRLDASVNLRRGLPEVGIRNFGNLSPALS